MEFKDKYTNSPPINHHVRLFTFIIVSAGVIAGVFYAYIYICGSKCTNTLPNPDTGTPNTIQTNSNTLTDAEFKIKQEQIREAAAVTPVPLTEEELKIKQAQIREAAAVTPVPLTEEELKIKQEQLNNI